MTSPRFTDAQLADLKARNPCDQVAAKYVRLRQHGRKMMGPCPLHSPDRQAKDSTAFECDADGWVCAVCADGGDVIKLIEKVEGKNFVEAVEWLGGVGVSDPAEQEKHAKLAADKKLERARDAAFFRKRERGSLVEIWKRALPIPSSAAAAYLEHRCLPVMDYPRLRCMPDMPYYASGAHTAEVIHRGPCLVAAVSGRDGHFAGLHLTYLDPQTRSGKLALKDSTSGELLPSKKMRGSKDGGRIELSICVDPRQLVIGEGIETVLSVWRALLQVGRDLEHTIFLSALDLGNLGGRASEALTHPRLKTAAGRALRLPGPLPDPDAQGLPIPESVTDVVILGDGDSESFLTRCAIARAAVRFASPIRTVRVAWAPDGKDFNDLLREAA